MSDPLPRRVAQRTEAGHRRIIVPLYRVDIERTLLVIADDDELASEVALRNEHRESVNDPDSVTVRKISARQDVPQPWLECRPYADSHEGRLTVAQILERDAQSCPDHDAPRIEP